MTKFEVPIWDANAIGDNACKEAFKHKNKISNTGKIKKAKVKKTLPIKQNTLKNQINSAKKNTPSNNATGKKPNQEEKPNKKKPWKLKNKNSIGKQVQSTPKQKLGNIDDANKNAKSDFKNKKVKKQFNLEKKNSAQFSQITTFKEKSLKKKLMQTQSKVNVSSSTGIVNSAAVKKRNINKIKEKIKSNSQDNSSTGILNNTHIKNKKKLNVIKEKIESNSQDDSLGVKNKKKKLNKTEKKVQSNSHDVLVNNLNRKNKKFTNVGEEITVNGNEDKKPFFEGNKKLSRIVREKIKQTLEVKSSKTKWHNLPLRERMMEKLKSARFRYLNEEIYTNTSKNAVELFKSDPSAFKAYHEGYRQQVARWPLNPLDSIIIKIKKMPKNVIVADFGCGEGRLAQSVSQKVHSFDIVAANKKIIACDMANVPLKNNSIDVVVFCLSLMGTNLIDYLFEANRVLKLGGVLIIAEVESRFDTVETFVAGVERVGFKNAWKDLSHNLFYFLDFKKMTDIKNKKKLPTISLHPCLYKKR